MAAQHYYLHVDDFSRARGADSALSFEGSTAPAFAAALQSALRQPALFERWRSGRPDPDAVDPALGALDANAQVTATLAESGAGGDIKVSTALPYAVLKHRLNLLIGSKWTLGDVNAG